MLQQLLGWQQRLKRFSLGRQQRGAFGAQHLGAQLLLQPVLQAGAQLAGAAQAGAQAGAHAAGAAHAGAQAAGAQAAGAAHAGAQLFVGQHALRGAQQDGAGAQQLPRPNQPASATLANRTRAAVKVIHFIVNVSWKDVFVWGEGDKLRRPFRVRSPSAARRESNARIAVWESPGYVSSAVFIFHYGNRLSAASKQNERRVVPNLPATPGPVVTEVTDRPGLPFIAWTGRIDSARNSPAARHSTEHSLTAKICSFPM